MSHVVSAEIASNVLSVPVEAGQRVDCADSVTKVEVLAPGGARLNRARAVAAGDVVRDGGPLVVMAAAR